MEGGYRLRTLKLSMIAISSVVLVEISLGSAVGSLAIVSDGLHALLDTLTTFMLFFTTRMSLKPPDEEHMYGHEKFEPIGGLMGGIALIGIALLILYEAILRIFGNQPVNLGLEYVGFVAIGFTFCVDFFRVGIFSKATKSQSSTMKAGFYHAIADLSSTVIAFVGFGLATLGINVGDALASVVLSVFLSYLSIKLVWSSAMELSDTISKDIADRVRQEILATKAVCKCKDLKIRRVGDKTFIRVTVQVPDYLNLEEAHDLTSQIEANIERVVGNAEVAIHAEPCKSELSTEKLVEKLATGVHGVKEAHEVSTAYIDSKLYVTLHAYVDPKLSVKEAHEIAERVEGTIIAKVANIENVTVHIEPFSPERQRGSTVDENEIMKVVYGLGENYRHTFRIKRIVTYVADKKRHINIDCSFIKQMSIEEAHRITSQIEEALREHFEETVVVVHMEPS